MTKEKLKQIYYLNQEIKMWQKELERLQCKSLVKGQEITGMPFVGGTSDKVGDMVTQIVEIEQIIRGKLSEIQLQRKKIIEYINSIEDSFIRQIIFLRNVSCMNWNQVANEIGGDNNEDSVKKVYYRFLEDKAEENNRIGDNLKKLVKEKGITIKELSQKTEISYNTLYAIIKRNNKKLDSKIAEKIVKALNITLNDLFST